MEAELGKLAGMEDGLVVAERESRMTDPRVVADFLERTRADVLAVTIGNVHGPYASPDPELDWARLDACRVAAGSKVPLVLHGASGLPEPVVRRAIAAGVWAGLGGGTSGFFRVKWFGDYWRKIR